MGKKIFTAEFKAKVAIEVLKANKTISELSSEFGVHATQINLWKKQLPEESKRLFSGKHAKEANIFGEERDRLYSQIGQLAVELDWL